MSSRIHNDFKKSLCGTGISAKPYDYKSKVSFLIDRNIGLDLWYLKDSHFSRVQEDKSLLLLCASRRFLRPNFHGVIGGGKQWEKTWEKNMRKASTRVRIAAYCLLSLTQPRPQSGMVTLCEFGRWECVSDQYIILGFPNLSLSLSSWVLEARIGEWIRYHWATLYFALNKPHPFL